MKDLKLRNTLLLQLVEQAQDGITIAEKEGPDTILIYANPAFERLTGYHLDEALYQDCRFLQGSDTDKEAVHQIRQAITESRPVRTVLKNYRKDGTPFWNELSITPFYDEHDQLTYFIGIQKDVTEEVKLRQALEAAQQRIAELEKQLSE
ncbi:PAS domain-containing protein [Thiomicrorhabdus sp. zzn3]|uniref:PAS domain-containing protein n=1 Tax=Thiomicrorhabdus sp. zzn3 TaxID=3039775 RepID=UPI0024364B10|nr:PAS domain-containing protein [Thiomicrorhabdus sp. zzn3]MDG6777167.1 PAS domain-containing protein [Thiomicrorhabdus sp. zzn3]